jgi:predicted TIM-barrel fold metal-dependent hydrolase
MYKIISAHSHLLTEPVELEFFADKYSQIWMLGLPESCQIGGGYSHPASEKEMLAVAKRFPGLYLPFKWVDFRQGPDQIDRAVEQGFIGFKGIYPQKSYDDESYLPIYERIASYRCPMIFHTGYVTVHSYAQRSPDCFYQVGNMRPSALHMIGWMFPEITVIAAHFGIPWEKELLDICVNDIPNFYIDLSGGHTEEILQLVGEHAGRKAVLSDGSAGVLADKLLLGLDAYFGHPQLHQDSYRYCNAFIASLEEMAKTNPVLKEKIPGILGGNAERIMNENPLYRNLYS